MSAARPAFTRRARRRTQPKVQLETWVGLAAGGCHLAIPVSEVGEVVAGEAARLDPGAPAPLRGTVPCQGGRAAVMDLARRLSLSGSGDPRGPVVVVKGGERLGLWVDAVTGLLPVDRRAVQPVPAGLLEEEGSHLLGFYLLPKDEAAEEDPDRAGSAAAGSGGSEEEASPGTAGGLVAAGRNAGASAELQGLDLEGETGDGHGKSDWLILLEVGRLL